MKPKDVLLGTKLLRFALGNFVSSESGSRKRECYKILLEPGDRFRFPSGARVASKKANRPWTLNIRQSRMGLKVPCFVAHRQLKALNGRRVDIENSWVGPMGGKS